MHPWIEATADVIAVAAMIGGTAAVLVFTLQWVLSGWRQRRDSRRYALGPRR